MKNFRRFLRSFFKTLAFLCLGLLLSASFLPFRAVKALPAAEESAAIRTVGRGETVEHLFTHCLIAHPEVAFAENNEYGRHLDEDCLTPDEFRRILGFLYEGGYALADIRKTFRADGESAERIPFSFPADKKPLVLSFDDVVYATKNLGKGMADRLVVTQTGDIAAYTRAHTPQIHGNEFVPILEDFIAKHPDFSYENARGTIFLTGFDGILGYRTQRDFPDRTAECRRAEKVVNALKSKGWSFGCHSYAHGHMNRYTAEKMRSDVRKWKDEVEPLVGKTQLYAYPYGEWTLGKNCDDERQQALTEAGFRLFFGVGDKAFYTKMPLGESAKKVLFQDRCAMDGISLRSNHCARFFDAKLVYDPSRPVSFPSH